MQRGLGPSLAWRKNREALKDATWVILTDDDRAPKIASKFFDGAIHVYPVLRHPTKNLTDEIHRCLLSDSQFLMAPPDTVFADGSIASMLRCATQPKTVVGVAHVRVNPTFLDSMPYLTPAPMVTHAWEHLHKSWIYAEESEYANSFTGGVSWRYLNPSTIAVQHRLPTPYLVNFKYADLEYFSHERFSVWDHEWPTLLVHHERWRYIGSSDAAFIAEVTDQDKNIPPPGYLPPDETDAFHRDLIHNKTNRLFFSIFRKGYIK